MSRLEPRKLIDAARARSGLDDLGGETFLDGLEVLVDSIDAEARLSDPGRLRLATMITARIVNRLEIQDWCSRFPEMTRGEIREPWFIVGPWRSATTILSYLMAQDSRLRCLVRWEASRPCPPPGVDGAADIHRLEEMREAIRAQDLAAPSIRKMNLQEADGPTECVIPLSHEFRGGLFDTFAFVPSYSAWNRSTDASPAYEYHRRYLQLLQWRRPGERWLLKAPGHLLGLDALLRTYPDARLIFTHRDPVQALPSACNFWETQMRMSSDHVDPVAIGSWWTEVFSDALDAVLRVRERVDASRFIDVPHAAFGRDPIGTVARIHDAFDSTLPAAAEKRMQQFLDTHPRNEYGVHEYSAERFGLTSEGIAERFSRYRSLEAVSEEIHR